MPERSACKQHRHVRSGVGVRVSKVRAVEDHGAIQKGLAVLLNALQPFEKIRE